MARWRRQITLASFFCMLKGVRSLPLAVTPSWHCQPTIALKTAA